MKKSIQIVVLSLFILFNYSCSSDDSDTIIEPGGQLEIPVLVVPDVSYGTDPQQRYDIYLPNNRTLNTKVIIMIHGGGWTSGDKSDMNTYFESFQQDLPQYALVNMNYRLADNTTSPFPMQLDDITVLINELKTKSSEYQISEEYALMGVSAGGHLSLLWSYAYDTNNDVNMVCSIVGPTNLADEAYLNNPDQAVQDIIDLVGIDTVMPFLELYSPLTHATNSAPPTILFYGGQDPLIPNSQGDDLSTELTQLGVTHEYTFYPNEGHGWTGINALDTWNKLKAFIETHH